MKNLTIILLLSCLSLVSFAQKHKMHNEELIQKVESEKISYLTTALELTVEEAQAFWPIYNECSLKVRELFNEERSLHHELKRNLDNLTNEQIKENIKKSDAVRVSIELLHQEYNSKYLDVLSARKVAQLQVSEHRFKRQLLDKYRKEYKGGGSRHN